MGLLALPELWWLSVGLVSRQEETKGVTVELEGVCQHGPQQSETPEVCWVGAADIV